MPDFHRLVSPTYLGGVPATHDEINNATSGIPAIADVVKGSGPNAGSYFIAFGEDGTSSNGNRAHVALANNTDYLDNIANGEVPIIANVDGTAPGGGLTSLVLAGDVFVGKSGTANSVDERDRLIKVVNTVTGNDVIDISGVTVKASLIHDGASANQVGVPASGFYTAPTVNFSPNIPATTPYRIFYARRSSFRDISLDKVGLDAFTRQVVRGAHQLPGEGVRFIRESARRSGGSGSAVTALAASIIETPGLGENILSKSNTMTMDVDPDESFAFNGAFAVRYHRDGTPKTLFSVLEGASSGSSIWQNTSERIALADLNTLASGFGQTILPFSSGVAVDGDNHLRLMETDFASEPVSLLKRLNAVWSVTVGDGIDSFGDFNGITAITDAFDHYNSEGLTTGLRIFVKRGTYEVSQEILFSGSHIIIEGAHKDLVFIRNVHASSFAFGNTLPGTFLVLRNVTLERDGANSSIGLSVVGKTLIDNCDFLDQQISIPRNGVVPGGTPVFLARNSRFVMSSSTTGVPPVEILAGNTNLSSGFFFDDCELSAWQDAPLFRVRNNSAAAVRKVTGIHFRRCTMNCAGTATLTGDLTAVVGVLELDGAGLSTVSIGDIVYEDCNVVANHGAVGDNQILMYVRVYDGAGGTMVFDRLTIRGGTWDAGSSSTDINPFYVGPDVWSAVSPVGEVRIENLSWGFNTAGNGNGSPAAEVSSLAANEWAFATISIFRLVMHNVSWLTNTAKSDSGDLYCNTHHYNINGLFLITGAVAWGDGAGGSPKFRVKLEGYAFAPGGGSHIRGVAINDNGVTTVDPATEGLIHLQPHTITKFQPVWVVELLALGNFSALTGAGVYLPGGTSGRTPEIHFKDCSLFQLSGNGFHFNSSGTAQILTDLFFDGCSVTSCGGIGLLIDNTGDDFGTVRVANCRFRDCGSFALDVLAGTWSSSYAGLVLSANVFDGNNGASSATQARLSSGTTSVGSAYGNSSPGGATSGAVQQVGGPSAQFRGTETGYTYDPVAGAVATIAYGVTVTTSTADLRLHTSGQPMMHNNMRWAT